jgi:hypothetical protein
LGFGKDDQLSWFAHRKRLQENGIDNPEDPRVGPDPNGKRHDRNTSKDRIAYKLPGGVAKVFDNGVDPEGQTHASHLLIGHSQQYDFPEQEIVSAGCFSGGDSSV